MRSQTLAQCHRQCALRPSQRHCLGAGFRRQLLHQRLLLGRRGAGDHISVLHPLALLQQHHRHLALASRLQRNANALRAAAVRQGRQDAVGPP